MNFDFSDEQKQLKDQARRFLADKCPTQAVRAVLEGREPFDRKLWQALAEMGYMGTAIPEQYGGLGAGYLELCIIAEELGRALAPVPFSSSIYLAAEFLLAAGSETQKNAWLPLLASGEKIGCFAHAEGAGRVSPAMIQLRVSGNRLSGTKMAVLDGDVADFAVVTARTAAGDQARDISLFLVDLNGAKLGFDGAIGEPLGAAGEGRWLVSAVLDRAAVLTAFEQIGGAERALEMARDYALERIAFGRPIGSFQAIKHMLADMYVTLTLGRSNAYYGAWALSTGAAQLAEAAATARVSATQAYQQCAKNCIQVHGGMGFTWQFDCHLHYRRSNALALAHGSQSQWEDLLIERLQARNAAA